MLALLVPGVRMGGGGLVRPAPVEAWWEEPSWLLEWDDDEERAMTWEEPSWDLEWEEDMATRQAIEIHKGSAASLVFSPRGGAEDVSAWSLRLDVSRPLRLGGDGTPVLTLATGGSGIVGSALGVITCTVSRAQCLLLSGVYDYTLSRSSDGVVLAEGRLTVLPVARE